ncbi:MAG: hypothetical protein F9K44_04285 [Hyphomicrobiaceae bacterium]|nr:MAG: hypothetical protein F9K44_04285 [Hyphomicrobiaceae bacterium]
MALLACAAILGSLLAWSPPVSAQERSFPRFDWFRGKTRGGIYDQPPPQSFPQPTDPRLADPFPPGPRTTPIDPRQTSETFVEKKDLAPVIADDGSGLPHDLWRGLSVPEIEKLMAGLAMPPRSAALNDLWRRVVASKSAEPSGGRTASHFLALRLEALYRSGLLAQLAESSRAANAAVDDPVLAVQGAKAMLGLGDRAEACKKIRAGRFEGAEIPRPLARDAMVLLAYCSALEGNAPAAGLTLELAREQGLEVGFPTSIVDLISAGAPIALAKIAIPQDLTLVDYAFLSLASKDARPRVLERAEPALVTSLALSTEGDARSRLEAGEEAARLNSIAPSDLALLYRSVRLGVAEQSGQQLERLPPSMRRAALLQSIDREHSPRAKLAIMQSLLAVARSQSLYTPAARMLKTELQGLEPGPETSAYAETAIEIALAAGEPRLAARWLEAALGDPSQGRALAHWLMLIEIAGSRVADPRLSGLAITEELATRGRFPAELMHRLITVLDALEFDIPIPLWEAASRTPQPSKGYLPETGLLAHLKSATADKRYGLAVLLTMRALGPEGAEGAHIIALGDSIRALKAVGLEPDARRLALEALFPSWPRQAVR